MRAALLAIGCAARAATHADSADQLIVNDDRQAAFLDCQDELVDPDQRRNVIECAICQHIGGLASEKCGARLVLGGFLIDLGLTIHPMLMDNLALRVKYHDRYRVQRGQGPAFALLPTFPFTVSRQPKPSAGSSLDAVKPHSLSVLPLSKADPRPTGAV